MTIVIPKPDFFDQLLKLLGKKRGVAVHGNAAHPDAAQTYYAPKKESILDALTRGSGKELPDGMIDIFTLQSVEGSGTGHRQKRLHLSLSGMIPQELVPQALRPACTRSHRKMSLPRLH